MKRSSVRQSGAIFKPEMLRKPIKLDESLLCHIYYKLLKLNRGVIQPGSEAMKLSVVFNASIKTAGKLSLNDGLCSLRRM